MECKLIQLDRADYLEGIFFFSKQQGPREFWGIGRNLDPDERDSPILITHKSERGSYIVSEDGLERVVVSKLSCEIFLSDLAEAKLQVDRVNRITFGEDVTYSCSELLPDNWNDSLSMRDNMMMMFRKICGNRLIVP